MIEKSRAYLLHRVLERKAEDVEVIGTYCPPHHPYKRPKLYFGGKFNQNIPILGILGTAEDETSFKTEKWDGRSTFSLTQRHTSEPGNWRSVFYRKCQSPKKDLDRQAFGGLPKKRLFSYFSVNVAIC